MSYSVSDSGMAEWLSSAYGDVEAARAMRLPRELRVHLYPEVLRWGPNGLRVASLLDAVGDPASASPELRAAADALFVAAAGRSRHTRALRGDIACLYVELSVACNASIETPLIRSLGASKTVELGVLVSALWLNAAWFPVFAEWFAGDGALVGEFLAAAGFIAPSVSNWGVAHA